MGLPHISQGISSVLSFVLCPPGSGCDRATTRASGKRTHSRRPHLILSIVRFRFTIKYEKTVEKARFLLPSWANRRYPPTKRHRLCGVSGEICMRDIRHNVEATNEIVRTRRAFSFRRIMQAKASCCASRRTPCGVHFARRKRFVPRCYANKKDTAKSVSFLLA